MVRQTPTQYPSPSSQRGQHWDHSLRTTQQSTVRQPYLGSPPNVVGATNFGTGSGAQIKPSGSDADQSQGVVAIFVGPSPGASPTLTLRFPAGIVASQYVFMCEWASVAAGAPAGGQITLTFTLNRTLIPGETLLMAYQWAVST